MPLRSKISASSPVRSRHFLTNDLIGESDSKASFDVLAERLLQRLCLTADFRNGFLKTMDAALNGLCCADKTRIQNLCLVLLRSIPDSELSGNLRLIEKLLSVSAVLLRSVPQDGALFDAETQSLLQAMLENEVELTRIYRTHQQSGLNALVLLSGFYAAVQKIYTLSLHDALPISNGSLWPPSIRAAFVFCVRCVDLNDNTLANAHDRARLSSREVPRAAFFIACSFRTRLS